MKRRQPSVMASNRGVWFVFQQAIRDIELKQLFIKSADIIRVGIAEKLCGLIQGQILFFHQRSNAFQLDTVDISHNRRFFTLLEHIAEIFGRDSQSIGNVGLPDRLADVLKSIILYFFHILPDALIDRICPFHAILALFTPPPQTWGGRGRKFKSCHSDQIKPKTNRFRLYFLHFRGKIERFPTTFAPPEIPKIF